MTGGQVAGVIEPWKTDRQRLFLASLPSLNLFNYRNLSDKQANVKFESRNPFRKAIDPASG